MNESELEIPDERETIAEILDEWVAAVAADCGDDSSQAEEAKREAEEIKQHMQNHAPEDTWWRDEDGNCFFNPIADA